MSRRFGNIGPQLKADGWDVVPVLEKAKKCVEADWPQGFSPEQVQAFAAKQYASGNVGLLARAFPGVDIDVLDAECAAALEGAALAELGAAPVRVGAWPKRLLLYRTSAPFAKVKVFLTDPKGNKCGADGKQYAIEFLGAGQQFVIYGRHPDGHEYTWPKNDGPCERAPGELLEITADQVNKFIASLPAWLPKGWSVNNADISPARSELNADDFASYKRPRDDWDAARIRLELLPYVDVETHYDDWLAAGQALHHQFGGSDEGYELWDEMFRDSSKYKSSEGRPKWDSFKTSRPGSEVITLGTLVHRVSARKELASRQARGELMKELLGEVDLALDVAQLQEAIAVRAAQSADLLEAQREQLAAAIQARAKELGTRFKIDSVRRWLSPVADAHALAMPDWAKPWVFLTDGDKFFNTQTKQELTTLGFRNTFNRLMPIGRDGREDADKGALDQWNMPTAAHKAYWPGYPPVFELNGLSWVNLYRPDSLPEIPATYSPGDLAAIALIELHLDTFLADPRERHLLLSWLAHNVQKPGVKIRWAPYIHGVPGDGKSYFSELLKAAMGPQNVRSLNGSTLNSDFTDWACGYAIVGIEEMKQHGQNRFEVMNKLKPFITNDDVEVHPKGKASYCQPNVTNYLITSNYLDGAPVDEVDRRYMFVSSQVTHEQAERITKDGYFERLYGVLPQHGGAIRKWLLEVELHPDFSANGRAPDTAVKATVVELSKSALEIAAEDLIERGAEGISSHVVSSAHLTRALEARGLDKPSTSSVNTLLTRLHYVYRERLSWKGETVRAWRKVGSGLDVRVALDATLDREFLS